MPALESLPRKIGPYRVLEKIGEGGMGVVYLASDAENRPVAVKVLGPAVAGDPDARLRLAREVETMRRGRRRYVAQVVDADVYGPSPYIVTRYVHGPSLDAAVRKGGPLRGRALLQLAGGLAEALAAIHATGVVHRDLKPGNVLLDDGQPVVIDFGIAHLPDTTRLTKTGLVMGTPGYLAPEVIEGRPASGATDVHAWGARRARGGRPRALRRARPPAVRHGRLPARVLPDQRGQGGPRRRPAAAAAAGDGRAVGRPAVPPDRAVAGQPVRRVGRERGRADVARWRPAGAGAAGADRGARARPGGPAAVPIARAGRGRPGRTP